LEFEKICVLGLGYIGLPTASTFATHGLDVVGVDVNQKVLNTLRNGGLHLHEPGLRTLVQAAFGSNKLVLSDIPQASDAFIITVPTPFYDDKRADLRYVKSAAEAIAPFIQEGNLVVLESTSPPGTTVDVVAPILEESGLKAGRDFFLVYSPERVLPGQILRELIENARVIGGVTEQSAEIGRDLYRIFVRGEIILTDATTAEMIKLMENTYRDVNIAIANEFSRLADRFGVDIWEAIQIANRHPRVEILRPGPGVGGHCISVDPWFLVEAAPDISTLIRTARKVNDAQPEFVVDIIQRALSDGEEETLAGKKIALFGLAYKPDVDDMRESPAIDIAKRLTTLGVKVKAFEPYKGPGLINGIENAETLQAALTEVDGFVLLVPHSSFKDINPEDIIQLTDARIAIDVVNVWDPDKWADTGFKLFRLGAPPKE